MFRGARMRWGSYAPPASGIPLDALALSIYPEFLFPPKVQFTVYFAPDLSVSSTLITPATNSPTQNAKGPQGIRDLLAANGITLVHVRSDVVKIYRTSEAARYAASSPHEDFENASVNALPESELHRHTTRPQDSVHSLRQPLPAKAPADAAWLNPFGPLTTKAAKAAGLQGDAIKPYALLYTYSLIIALVCGTAGLPHILVRFYTNPDGVAAKRTTMWVMILIGVFYVFPPVFGVMGRNLMPALYEGTGAKGTDKIVLELPRVLDSSPTGSGSASAPTAPSGDTPARPRTAWGSILSGITCAGAFAAFMSTFSGLLVSMTGALAHDVYGRMLRPQSTAADRMRMFKWCAALIGGIATLLGCFVEPLEINFMVGQAFAIAAASYFPLLFMSVWWRGMTIRGAATGMLTGGLCALIAVALTNASNLALDKGPMGQLFSAFAPLNAFWAAHPLLRILCEQPAIWTVPLAIALILVLSVV
jgi:Na+(H+)/acetate symporter ActP